MPLDNRQNYFELFGIEPAYAVNKQTIEEVYLRLQMLLHPDRFAAASEQQQRIAAQQSAYLNEAYAVLTDDCSRADYLLQLQGHTVNPDASMSDNDFLLQQMEYRERLETAATEQSGQQALALDSDISTQSSEISRNFARAYTGKMFDEAQSLLAQMRFMKKLKAEIKTIIDSKEGL